jgi:hypothetical protein
MKYVFRLFAVASVFICLAATAEAACSPAFYRSLEQRGYALTRSAAVCQRAIRSRARITTVCSACRNMLNQVSSAERVMRANRACLPGRETRRALALLNRYRPEIQFFRRGCGY